MKRLALLAAPLALIATPAFAHHPLAGKPMTTFADGLLSGVGHPLLGFDHLFFIVAVGVAAAFTAHPRLTPAAYIAAMLVGCLITSLGTALPAAEIMIAVSLLIVGGVVLSGRALDLPVAALLFAGFGLFHGSAFGVTIAEQEATAGVSVLLGYLLSLGVVQYAIAAGVAWLVATRFGTTGASAVPARLAGAVVAGAGLLLTMEHAEGLVFTAMGWTA